MKRFGILKIALLILVPGLNGCATLAPPPAVDQCQYNGSPRAFYCENTETKKREKISADSSKMKGAQCVSADDYRKGMEYLDYVIEEAQRRCN